MTGNHSATKAKNADFFRLVFEDIQWADESRLGFPLLFWPDGSLCEPATAFFGHLCKSGKGQRGALKDKAYIVRDWLVFLRQLSVPWHSATDKHFRQWREAHRPKAAAIERNETALQQSQESLANKAEISKRVAHKLSTIFNFYDVLRMAYSKTSILSSLPLIGRETDEARNITLRVITTTAGKRKVWGNHERGKAADQQPTPTNAEVNRISGYLRTGSPRENSDADNHFIHSERNWAIERCMSLANCRCCETAALNLNEIWSALPTPCISDRLPEKTGCHPLEWLADHDDLKQRLLSELSLFKRRGYKTLSIKVVGKGHPRKAPFPIDLVIDLLNAIVWEVRQRQIQLLKRADPTYSAPPELFLSSKTGRALAPGSIGDLIKVAFEAVGVLGSAHRLRARAGVNYAVSLRVERLSRSDFRVDQMWEDWELEQLREWMGHRNIDTTLSSYVQLATVELEAMRSLLTGAVNAPPEISVENLTQKQLIELAQKITAKLSKYSQRP